MPYSYRLADDVVFKEVSRGGVLLSRKSGEYRQVNATGARVLQLVVAGEPWQALLDDMVQLYPTVEPSQISQDLSGMLAELEGAGVLVRV